MSSNKFSIKTKLTRTIAKTGTLAPAAIACAFLLSGCTGPSLWEPMVQSNFVYPNSNIRSANALTIDNQGRILTGQETKKTISETYPIWSIPDFRSIKRAQKASDLAMKDVNANILVDGSIRTESHNYFLFWTIETTVSGKGIYQEVLRRDLNQKNIH